MRKALIVVPIVLSACGQVEDPVDERGIAAISAPSASTDGELGPLIPFHKDAIHAGFLSGGRGGPKLLVWMRPSEYRGDDLVDPTVGEIGALRTTTFEPLVLGDFGFSNTLDASVLSRIKADIPRDNALIFDLSHPDAFKNTGKFRPEELTPEDFALNAAAFKNAGHSSGLDYNIFCAGHDTLADGRWLVAGGHDKGGNNGIRKINIFDPKTLRWKRRVTPPVKRDFLADPTGAAFPHANPLDEANTDPPHKSDMKYQRWYPTVVTLPDGRVLILSGTDQDTSNPDTASSTKVRQAVPEIYDPKTDTTIALENARKLLPMYPRSFVVQTGPNPNDWKVAVTAEVQPPLPTNVTPFDPWNYNGNTHYLDVQAALADMERNVPGEKHWTLVATARHSHDSGASAAIFETDKRGRAVSQKAILFGGEGAQGAVSAVESIDFAKPNPAWTHVTDIVRPVTQNNAVVLPDGKVVVVGGRGNQINTYEVQLFDPKTGAIRTVAQTTVPRHDHSTALLTDDGTVLIMGGNRTEIVPTNRDLGVPVAQVYKPPYLFKGQRPRIERAPEHVDYGDWFDIKVSRDCKKIESVVIVRLSPVTHNWQWGNRYVKLGFERTKHDRIAVRTPSHLGAAPPGYYMLFVLDEDGVPSVARRIRLGEDAER